MRRALAAAAGFHAGVARWFLQLLAALALCAQVGAAQAQQDLIVVRSLPIASGPTASTITYEVAYKNAGPGAADGAKIVEQLPNGFQVLNLSCVSASAGAVCPSTTILGNDPANYPMPRIEGTIASFPEFAVVRLRVQMKLSPEPGNFSLHGTITGLEPDPVAETNGVLSSLYVRPLLLDLATSYSSSLPVIGGASGLGGVANATYDGNTIANHFPLSVAYRMDNHGPDTAPGGAFHWPLGNDNFANWVSTSWSQATYGSPVGYESSRRISTDPDTGVTTTRVSYSEVRITPYTCQATGAAICPAPVLYKLAGSAVNSGWLARAPVVSVRSIIGDSIPNSYYSDPFIREIALADMEEAKQNTSPHFGQDFPPNSALILTATLVDAKYGPNSVSQLDPVTQTRLRTFVEQEGMFTQTDQLSTTRCRANPKDILRLSSQVSYADPTTGRPLANVNDSDLDNNQWTSNIGLTRDCPLADLVVTAQASVEGSPASQVSDGQDYAMTYTVTNNGPSNISRVELEGNVHDGGNLGSTFVRAINWNGFTRAVSCTSTDPNASPCPTQEALDAWMASPSNSQFASPLASGSTWTIVVAGNAGTTGCTAGKTYESYTWQGNLRAWGAAVGVPDESGNYAKGSNRTLSFVPTGACPTQPARFNLSVSKTALSAESAATAVNVGDYAYFNVVLRNTSSEGIALHDVSFRDYIQEMRYTSTNGTASVAQDAPGPFQREAGQAAGLDITVRIYNPGTNAHEELTFPSGVVCTAHGAAQCPASLSGSANNLANAQAGSYNQVEAVIPLLPAGAEDYIELRMPWLAQPDAYGCALKENTGRYNVNTARLSANKDSIAAFPDGTQVAASTLKHTSGSDLAQVYNKLDPCPSGMPGGTLQKTLRGYGAGTVSGGNVSGYTTSYEAAVSSGDTLIYDVVLTSTGTLGINSYIFYDYKVQPICRDGIPSKPLRGEASARCGEVVLTGLSCAATGGAACPSTEALAAALDKANSRPEGYIQVSDGAISNYANPVIPMGGALTFTTSYTVSSVNSFTGKLLNRANYNGRSGDDGFYPPQAMAELKMPEAAGIALSKDVDKLQVGEGETVSYTIDVTNGGNGPLAAGATFVDPLPAGLAAFASVSCTGLPGPAALPSNGSGVCPASITNDASGVSATLPQMQPNTTLRFVITAEAPSGGVITSIGNEARVLIPTGASQATLLASANFAIPSAKESASTQPMQGFKSVRNASSGGNSVLPGEQLIYTISYANVGGMDIANLQITDVLPSHVSYSGGASLSTTGPVTSGSINPGYDGVTDTQLLAPGAQLGGAGTITITVPVTVNAGVAAGTVIANQAYASGSGVTGKVPTDNVDNTNPACPVAAPAPCLPDGVGVPAGSVPQSQTPSLDPVLVGVGKPAVNPGKPGQPRTPGEAVAIPATSPAQLMLLTVLLMLGWGARLPRNAAAKQHAGR